MITAGHNSVVTQFYEGFKLGDSPDGSPINRATNQIAPVITDVSSRPLIIFQCAIMSMLLLMSILCMWLIHRHFEPSYRGGWLASQVAAPCQPSLALTLSHHTSTTSAVVSGSAAARADAQDGGRTHRHPA